MTYVFVKLHNFFYRCKCMSLLYVNCISLIIFSTLIHNLNQSLLIVRLVENMICKLAMGFIIALYVFNSCDVGKIIESLNNLRKRNL